MNMTSEQVIDMYGELFRSLGRQFTDGRLTAREFILGDEVLVKLRDDLLSRAIEREAGG